MDHFPRVPGLLARRQRGRRGLVTLLVLLLAFSGCSPIINRFFARALSQLGAPIASVKHKVSDPVLSSVGLSILWVGHATTLIQIGDKVFITDPLFTKTVGMLMRRSIEAGLDPSTLSRIDYTLISHIHLDHFSYGSLDMLPKGGKLLVPLGALRYTPDFDFREIRELRPWDALDEDGVRITAVPVQHFSGRYGFDTPWTRDLGYTGYIIECNGVTVFFGGDTGYHPELFKEIGRRFSIDIAILPIAPIEPRDFLARNHIDPKEAIQVFEDLGATRLLPIHHRSLNQGFDPTPMFPVELLRKLADERGIKDKLIVLEIGEQRVITDSVSQTLRQ